MEPVNAVFLPDRTIGFEVVISSGINRSYPVHAHVSTHVVGIVRQGMVRVKRSGKTELHRAGGFFHLPPYEPHSLETVGRCEMVSACVDKSLPGKAGGDSGMREVFRAVSRLVREGRLLRDEGAILKRVLRRLPADGGGEGDALDGLRRVLEECPETPLDLAEMVRIAHVGKRHLIRRFKERYGLPPHRFQALNRVRKAKRECSAARSLTGTALAAGFYDQSHFIREFRRHLGMTPRQYRAALRES